MRNIIKIFWALTLLFAALYFVPVSGMLFFTFIQSFLLVGYYGLLGFSIFTKVRKIFKKESYKSISISSIIFAIILGLFFAILILFAQYRMRLAPYTQEILLYLVIPFVVFISVLFFASRIQFKELVRANYLHFVFMGVFVLTFLVTPNKVLVSAIWPNEPEIQDALTEHLNNPSDEDAERKAFELIEVKENARMEKEMEEYNKVNRR